MTLLLEREAELDRAGDALGSALAGTGEVLVVAGAPGIGKTRLMDEIRISARRRGLRVLAAKGGELEQEFPYGVVRQLFDPVLRRQQDQDELLAGAAALALPALSFAPTGGAVASEPSIMHGLYWLAAGLASRGPVVIVIDDAHWADTSSLHFAAYLARRIDGLRLALVLAARDAGVGQLETLLAEVAGGRPVLELEPLSQAAVVALVKGALGGTVAPAFARAIHAAAGGNPFLIAELIRAAAAEGLEPTAQSVPRLERLGMAGVDRWVRRRLARLAPGACALARAVAVLGDDAELRHAAALARLDASAAAAAAGSLAAADVFERGSPLSFCHALVRSSVAGELSAAERGELGGRAARLLHAEGASHERVAAHVLASEPSADPWAIEVLRDAARDAVAQGAPETAAKLLCRALAEPPSPELRGDVLLELGLAEAHVDTPASVEHLGQAEAALTDPVARGRAALVQAHGLVILMRPTEAVEVLTHQLDLAEREGGELALRIAAQLAIAARVDMRGDDALRARLERLAEGCRGETEGELGLLEALADKELGTTRSAAVTAALATRQLERAGNARAWNPVGTQGSAIVSLVLADRLDEAEPLVTDAIDEARRVGSAVGFQHGSAVRGLCRFQRGEVLRAEADLRAAVDTGRLFGHQFPPAVAGLVQVLVERGDLAEAEALLQETGLGGPVPRAMLFGPVLTCRSRLRGAQGRRDEAIADLRQAGAHYLESGITRPVPPWRSSLALLLAGTSPEEARVLAGEELEAAREWGTPRSLGVALHRLGLVQDGPAREVLLRDAVETLEASPARLELARALVDLGTNVRHRRATAEARRWLERAMDLAHACGATVLAAHARTELVATGVRPRRAARTGRDALTASERRVAEMAAAGLTNREIAQALFVTQRTVETHLGHAYQKLGHSTRERLAEDLGTNVIARSST